MTRLENWAGCNALHDVPVRLGQRYAGEMEWQTPLTKVTKSSRKPRLLNALAKFAEKIGDSK